MKRTIGFLIIFLVVISGCQSDKHKKNDKQVITVSILPQKYFVDELSGGQFEVNVMVPPGASPATYEPSPRQIRNIGNSLAYLRIGHIGFEEAWMNKIVSINQDLRIFDQSEGVDLLGGEHGTDERLGKDTAKGVDPHIWLSPKSVKVQIKNIRDMLIDLYPKNREAYTNNYQSLAAAVDTVDDQIRRTLQDVERREFLIFHPALSYFARDYQLEQIPVQSEGKEPGPGRIQAVVDQAKSKGIRVIFVQQQFSTDEAKVLAEELDGKVVKIDPLAYDWPGNLKNIARKIADALQD